MSFNKGDFYDLMTEGYFEIKCAESDRNDDIPAADLPEVKMSDKYSVDYARTHMIDNSENTFKTFCKSELCKGVCQLMTAVSRIPLQQIGENMVLSTESKDKRKLFYDQFMGYLRWQTGTDTSPNKFILEDYANAFIEFQTEAINNI